MMNYFHVCGIVRQTSACRIGPNAGIAVIIDVPSYQRTDTLVIYPQKPEHTESNRMLQPGQSVTVTGSIMVSQGQMFLIGAVQPWNVQMPQAQVQQSQMGYGYSNINNNYAAGGQYGQMNQSYQNQNNGSAVMNGGSFTAGPFGTSPAANTGFPNLNEQPVEPSMFGGGYASTIYAAQNAEMLGATNNEIINDMFQSAQSIQLDPQAVQNTAVRIESEDSKSE